MKKTLGLVVMGLLLIVAPAVAQTVTVGEYTANPGETVKVDVAVDAAVKGVAGAQLTLDYSTVTPAGGPSLVVDPSGATYGVIPANGLIEVNTDNPGVVGVGIAATTGGDGPGVLFSIPVKVPADAAPGAVYQLNLTFAELNDIEGNVIKTTAVGGKITVASGIKPKLTVGTYQGKAGDTVNVTINADAALNGVAGAQLVLNIGNIGTVDPASVKYGVIPAGGLIEANTSVAGQVGVGIAATTAGAGPGTLLTVPIQLRADLPAGTYPLTLSTAELNTTTGDLIAVDVVNGSLQVGAQVSLTILAPDTPAGAVAQVAINVDDKAKDLAGAHLVVSFGDIGTVDKAQIRYGVVPPGGVLVANTDTPGQVDLALVSSVGGNGPGTLFTIPIRLKAGLQPGTYPITITTAELTDSLGQPITAATTPGQLTVLPAPPPAQISLGNYTGIPGGTVNVQIGVDANAKSVAGAHVILQYGDVGTVDKTAVTYGVVPTGGVLVVNTDTPGQVDVGVVASSAGSGPGTLFTIPIKLRSDLAQGDYPLTVTLVELVDGSGAAVPVVPPPAGKITVGPPPAAQVTLEVSPSTAFPGRTVNLLVNINDKVQNVASAQVTVNFDTLGTVDASKVTYGVLPSGSVLTVNTAPGEVSVGVAATTGANGPGTLFTIPLTIGSGVQPGTYPVTITAATLTDDKGQAIPAVVTSGSVTVVAAPLLGDVNGDGKVDMADVQAVILLYFTGTYDIRADINGDGKVSVGDIRAVLRISLGLPPAGA